MNIVKLILKAMTNVDNKYILSPQYGKGLTPKKRERVYCYELYHQIRCLMEKIKNHDPENELNVYTVYGEPVKPGIHDFSGRMPDFVIHIPGKKDNFAVIEVKATGARGDEKDKTGVLGDIIKIYKMMENPIQPYTYGFFILIGHTKKWFEKWRKDAIDLLPNCEELKRFYVFFQTAAKGSKPYYITLAELRENEHKWHNL